MHNKEVFMKRTVVIASLFLLFSLPFAVQADTLRCGNRLVSTGDSDSTVLRICGEPAHRDAVRIEKRKVEKETAEGVVSETVTTRVERWTYNPGSGQLAKILTFRDGVLSSIEDGDRL